MKKHLAIFKDGAGEKILSGAKSIESRFSKGKKAPYGVVSGGDLVYIKPSGSDIIGQFRVKKVFCFDSLLPSDIEKIKADYGEELSVGSEYWNEKKNSRYGTLIFIGDSARFITSPIKVRKKDLRGWVVLGD